MVSAVDLFGDRDTARNCVSALQQNRQKTATVYVWSLMERGRPTAGGQATAVKWRLWSRLDYVVFLSKRQTMSCHVISCHIISCHPHHSVISHITCGRCSYCVSCHTGRYEDAVITGLLLLLLLFPDYFTECYCRRLADVSNAPVHPHSGYF
jgi:hypothetical protein